METVVVAARAVPSRCLPRSWNENYTLAPQSRTKQQDAQRSSGAVIIRVERCRHGAKVQRIFWNTGLLFPKHCVDLNLVKPASVRVPDGDKPRLADILDLTAVSLYDHFLSLTRTFLPLWTAVRRILAAAVWNFIRHVTLNCLNHSKSLNKGLSAALYRAWRLRQSQTISSCRGHRW